MDQKKQRAISLGPKKTYTGVDVLIREALQAAGRKIFRPIEIKRLFRLIRDEGRLPPKATFDSFLAFALAHTQLKRAILRSISISTVPSVTRFTWGEASVYELALSLKPATYLSHGTAVFLHGITEQIPKTIYVNFEQRPKPPSIDVPDQDAIDAAFSRPQRTSGYVLSHAGMRIVLLNGKHTGRLGVETVRGPNDEDLTATCLERTLVDIVVRPAYAGGVYRVLSAYEGAKGRASAARVAAILEKLAYVYPYHQVVGFYLSRAGYPGDSIAPLKSIRRQFDFYLVHGMKHHDYDPEWRLFIPKGF